MVIAALALALLATPAGALEQTAYMCVLHPDVRAEAPGSCRVCGFDLVPEELATSGMAAFTCPDHREIQQSIPGICPKCSRRLIVEDLRKRAEVGFVCPMHPAVTARFPGKCPRCAMDLVREDQADRRSAAYRCPMHREIVASQPAGCSRCGMKLVAVDPSELARFPVDFEIRPAAVASGQKVELRFTVSNPVTKKIATDFDVVHGERFHLFVVSQSLEYFDHIHPRQEHDGTWSITTVLPRAAYYRLYADFLPTGGTPQVIQKTLVTTDCASDLQASLARLAVDLAPKSAGGTTVILRSDPATFIAGREATLTYALTDTATGAPVRDLRPYLQAWGHTFILNADGSESIHSHPTDEVPPEALEGKVASKPEISFAVYFPKPGLYRVWTQFLRKDTVSTYVFTVEAKRLR